MCFNINETLQMAILVRDSRKSLLLNLQHQFRYLHHYDFKAMVLLSQNQICWMQTIFQIISEAKGEFMFLLFRSSFIFAFGMGYIFIYL